VYVSATWLINNKVSLKVSSTKNINKSNFHQRYYYYHNKNNAEHDDTDKIFVGFKKGKIIAKNGYFSLHF
jgi:major membrane immunogen (membrane-anchored lipoprotein)